MASGLGVYLPMTPDDQDGVKLLKTYKEVAQQNLKMVILTNPGERILLPDFGVGIHKLLFEGEYSTVRGDIITRIKKQVAKYLSYIQILDIQTNTEEKENTLYLSIKYQILPLNIIDDILISTNLSTK